MNTTRLLAASLVLAALLGLLYWSSHDKATEEKADKPSPDAAPKILSLNSSDIVALSIHHKDQTPIGLTRSTSGNWQITAPRPLAADQEDISNLLSTLSSLNSDRLVDERATDLAPYGLSNPDLQVDVTLKDHKTQKLLIGNQTPTGSAYYAMVVGEQRLFTLASYNKTSLDKTLNDLRDKRLVTADFDKISQIELLQEGAGKKQAITFARDQDSWQILKPLPCRADQGQVDELVRTLRDVKMNFTGETDDAKLAAAFHSASPSVIVRVTGTSGAQELEIRKSKDDYYARSTAVRGIYKTTGGIGTSLEKGLDDFRNKKLFDLGYQNPEKIELHDGSKSYFLTRSGMDWWGPDGKKLDAATVEALVDKIRALAANKFPDSVFPSPTLRLTVISNDGKRTERAALVKVGDHYIGKRENEPALYEIPNASVKELEESAEKIKSSTAAR